MEVVVMSSYKIVYATLHSTAFFVAVTYKECAVNMCVLKWQETTFSKLPVFEEFC